MCFQLLNYFTLRHFCFKNQILSCIYICPVRIFRISLPACYDNYHRTNQHYTKKYIKNKSTVHVTPFPRFIFVISTAHLCKSTLRFGRRKTIVHRTMCALPEAISAGGLTPTTDTSLFLTTYRSGSHLPADIAIFVF